MIWALGKTSHSTRNTASRASWEARTARRPRRSRRSQSRYCGDGFSVMPARPSAIASTFHMDFKLPPQGVEIDVELRRAACRQWRRTRRSRRGEADYVIRFDLARPPRQHDDPLRHAYRLADVVGNEDHGLALAAQDFADLVGERETRLRIERRERLVEKDHVGLRGERARQRNALAHATRKLARQMVQELAEAIAGQILAGALTGAPHVSALDLGTQYRVVQNGAPLEQIVLLQHVADLAARARDRPAVDQHGTSRRLQDARDERQQGALAAAALADDGRSEEHTSELQSPCNLVCR